MAMMRFLRRASAAALFGLSLSLLVLACDRSKEGAPDASAPPQESASASAASPQESASANIPASASSAAAEGAVDAGADAEADAEAALPGTSEGCPDDMVLVEGEYCPDVVQRCLEYHEEYVNDQERKKRKAAKGEEVGSSTVSERCLKYEAPSECLSKKKRPMRFCMDRYEWPNKKGELPALLISWLDAKKECEKLGKRMCSVDEFNFACEGEDMLPYTYGYERDPNKCNIDKPYRKRERKLKKYERCLKDPRCKAELEKLDQRLPTGSMPECVSPFGVYDLNGNINEWVSRPGKKYPNRSGLKGGWWGPVRGRCRPTVGFHKEEDYGYEEGFRCCKEAEPAPAK